MSFGKSFDEAFKTSNAQAQSGAFDILKEKIKANNETAQANNILDLYTAKAVEDATKAGKDPDEIKNSIKQFEQAKKMNLKPDQITSVMKALHPELVSDPTLIAQRESTTALNNSTAAMLQFAQKQAGINQPNQPKGGESSLSTISQVANSDNASKQTSSNEPLVPVLGVRGTQIVMPEATKQVEEMKAFAGAEGKYKQEKIQAGEKVFSGIRTWGKTLDQFEQAFPSGDKTPLQQRVSAVISGTAVKMGLMNEPQLLAAQRSLEVGARQALKDWGDKGALSNRDVDAAVRVLDLSNLTLQEKMAVIRGTTEKALSALDDDTLNATFERQPYMKDFIDAFGVKYGAASRASTLNTANQNDLASRARTILESRRKK